MPTTGRARTLMGMETDMAITKARFGCLQDGKEVFAYTMVGRSGLTVRVCNYGAAILSLLAPDKNGYFSDVVGGYDGLEGYVRSGGSQGAVVGRFANRIRNACFDLDGVTYHLAENCRGGHIHGGNKGFDRQVWEGETIDGEEPQVIFTYVSPDGEEGYPGTLTVQVIYTVTVKNGLSIRYLATTDKKTILNLTNHSYFNLGGLASGDVSDHLLTIDADSYLEPDPAIIPTGNMVAVEGTPFDFRTEKAIGRDIHSTHPHIAMTKGYDHCFCFSDVTSEIKLRATLKDPKSGRVMKMYTNQPCVQLYTCNGVRDDGLPLKGGLPKYEYMAACLETQHMPDSIHHEHFTDVKLDVGETFDYTTIYEFSAE